MVSENCRCKCIFASLERVKHSLLCTIIQLLSRRSLDSRYHNWPFSCSQPTWQTTHRAISPYRMAFVLLLCQCKLCGTLSGSLPRPLFSSSYPLPYSIMKEMKTGACSLENSNLPVTKELCMRHCRSQGRRILGALLWCLLIAGLACTILGLLYGMQLAYAHRRATASYIDIWCSCSIRRLR